MSTERRPGEALPSGRAHARPAVVPVALSGLSAPNGLCSTSGSACSAGTPPGRGTGGAVCVNCDVDARKCPNARSGSTGKAYAAPPPHILVGGCWGASHRVRPSRSCSSGGVSSGIESDSRGRESPPPILESAFRFAPPTAPAAEPHRRSGRAAARGVHLVRG